MSAMQSMGSKRFLGCLFLAATVASVDAGSCNEWGGQAMEGSSKCFKVSSSTSDGWDAALASCRAMDGELASIESEEENTFVHLQFKTAGMHRMWIGLTDRDAEGIWMWEDGSQSKYTNWGPGQPNSRRGEQDCATMWNRYGPGDWNDEPCNRRGNYYLCAKRFDGCEGWGGKSLPGSSKCFKASEGTADSFDAADEKCKAVGARLASIESVMENQVVENMIVESGDKRMWIGYTDEQEEGKWTWVDGSTSTFTSWGQGRPNNWRGRQDCAVMESGHKTEFWNMNELGHWDDRPCNSRGYRYVCARTFQGSSSSHSGSKVEPVPAGKHGSTILDDHSAPHKGSRTAVIAVVSVLAVGCAVALAVVGGLWYRRKVQAQGAGQKTEEEPGVALTEYMRFPDPLAPTLDA